MGKKKDASLGRSLIKDRFGGNKNRKFVSDNSMVRTFSNDLFLQVKLTRCFAVTHN